MASNIDRDFQEAVVEGAFQASKPIIFNMIDYDSQTGPRLVPELKPKGIVDDKGVLIGVRFQRVMGNDENVMARCEVAPNARVYQGVMDGFQPAMKAVFSGGADSPVTCISVPVLDKKLMTNIPAGHRKIWMEFRVVDGDFESKGYTCVKPINSQEVGPERAVIILPGSQELFSEVNNGLTSIILEEFPLGRSSSELVRVKLA